jgi:hypothetical protein
MTNSWFATVCIGHQSRLIALIAAAICAFQPATSRGKEPTRIVHVDNLRGTDESGDGSTESPFRTMKRGVAELKPGTLLDVANTGNAYHETVRVQTSGSAEEPIIIEGHGAVNSGLMRRPLKDWKAEGGGVFSIPLPNNAWGMQSHWEGGFDLVRFDGKPGLNVTSRDALEPFAYFLYKNQKELKTDPLHNTLFIRLPEGKTPDDIAVETVSLLSSFSILGSHVTVRHFISEFFGDDGFSSNKPAVNVVFERVEGRYNMDQGMSHHGAEVVARHSHFHHNAGCGVVDVYPEARTRYEDCLIEDDTWRGGVEFYSGKFEMVNCVIRGNRKNALLVNRGGEVTLRNCLLVGPEENKTPGVLVTENGKLTMDNCTVANFTTGLTVRPNAFASIRDSAFLNCKTNWEIGVAAEPSDLAAALSKTVFSNGNAYASAPFVLKGEKSYSATEWLEMRKASGSDACSLIFTPPANPLPLLLPELAGKGVDGADIGAHLLEMPTLKLK